MRYPNNLEIVTKKKPTSLPRKSTFTRDNYKATSYRSSANCKREPYNEHLKGLLLQNAGPSLDRPAGYRVAFHRSTGRNRVPYGPPYAAPLGECAAVEWIGRSRAVSTVRLDATAPLEDGH
ncbi:hypothetical protein Trydic_g15697 [Trypoxylus dichotomus]